MTAKTIPGYLDWSREHLTAFGLFTAASTQTVASWEQTFALLLCDAEELRDATAAMLGSSEPIQGYLDGHRTRLIQTVRAGRAAQAQRAGEEERSLCVRCQGSGRLIVPHPMPDAQGRPRALRAGHWVGVLHGGRAMFYEYAVRCPCERGHFGGFNTLKRNRGGQYEADRPMMTLEEYERINPHWQRQQAQRRAELVAEASHGGADAYDLALGRIRLRVAGFTSVEDERDKRREWWFAPGSQDRMTLGEALALYREGRDDG